MLTVSKLGLKNNLTPFEKLVILNQSWFILSFELLETSIK